jgi:hypothetical protein
MSFKFSFRVLNAVFFITLLMLSCLMVQAAEGDATQKTTVLQWFQSNWSIVALVLSESLALLPGKASGILQAIITGIGAILKKK